MLVRKEPQKEGQIKLTSELGWTMDGETKE
jgi:hypothetical protein